MCIRDSVHGDQPRPETRAQLQKPLIEPGTIQRTVHDEAFVRKTKGRKQIRRFPVAPVAHQKHDIFIFPVKPVHQTNVAFNPFNDVLGGTGAVFKGFTNQIRQMQVELSGNRLDFFV